jgi:hypothetical protein
LFGQESLIKNTVIPRTHASLSFGDTHSIPRNPMDFFFSFRLSQEIHWLDASDLNDEQIDRSSYFFIHGGEPPFPL